MPKTSQSSDYVIGIDGGQSSTTAIIANQDGEVLGRGTDGPCNHVSAAEAAAKFRRVIGGCVAQACAEAGIPEDTEFAAACFGFSGGAEDKRALAQEVVRSRDYYITHDGEIALWGAHSGAPGIIVVAGTGSIAFGRDAGGRIARAGGWGYVFGDEGSAFDIARQALRAILRFEEGWENPTALTDLLLNETGFGSANALMHACYTPEWPRQRLATLAPIITKCAEAGDRIARNIVSDAARNLAGYAGAVLKALDTPAPLPVAPIGGVFQSALLRNELARCLAAPLVTAAHEPAEGAVLLALTRLR